jgi:hypothetical protein
MTELHNRRSRRAAAGVADLAGATLGRIAALTNELDRLTDQLQALYESTSGADHPAREHLILAAVWSHQLSGNCTDGAAAAVRDLKRDLVDGWKEQQR